MSEVPGRRCRVSPPDMRTQTEATGMADAPSWAVSARLRLMLAETAGFADGLAAKTVW